MVACGVIARDGAQCGGGLSVYVYVDCGSEADGGRATVHTQKEGFSMSIVLGCMQYGNHIF